MEVEVIFFFFFFQAEDCIRDPLVTGVQTCALPIYTGVLLVFVAAGILGYGFHDLQEAGVLPGLNTLAFDASTAMPEDSWYGALLKGLLNYSAQTTVLQAVVWVLYVVIV